MLEAVKRLQSIGGEQVHDFDFKPFAETAVMLYGGSFVAERYAGIRAFLESRAPGLEPPELADLSIDQRLLKVYTDYEIMVFNKKARIYLIK